MSKNAKHKVLFLIHTLGGGGAEKILVDTVKQLDANKFDITVMTVINTGVYIKQLPEHIHYKTIFGGKILGRNKSTKTASGSLNAHKMAGLSFVPKIYNFIWKLMPVKLLYKLAVKEQYDTEIAFLEGISSKLIAASNNPKSKKIAWIHVDFSNEHKSKAVFTSANSEKRCYASFDEIICVSNETKRGFEKVIGLKKQTKVIPNLIDIEAIMTSTNGYKPVSNRLLTIAVIGRLTRQKGQDRLLKAIAKLKAKSINNYQIQLIGDGPDREKLERFAAEHQLDNVKFLGYKTDIYKWMLDADLCLITSRAEGFSTVMTEAILLSKPIITTKVSGTDWLPPQMVIANNEQAICKALEQVVTNKQYYRDLKRANKVARTELLSLNSLTAVKLEKVLV